MSAAPPPSDPDLAARLERSLRYTQKLAAKLDQPSSKFRRPRLKFKTRLGVQAAIDELSESKSMEAADRDELGDQTPCPDYA